MQVIITYINNNKYAYYITKGTNSNRSNYDGKTINIPADVKKPFSIWLVCETVS